MHIVFAVVFVYSAAVVAVGTAIDAVNYLVDDE